MRHRAGSQNLHISALDIGSELRVANARVCMIVDVSTVTATPLKHLGRAILRGSGVLTIFLKGCERHFICSFKKDAQSRFELCYSGIAAQYQTGPGDRSESYPCYLEPPSLNPSDLI